MLNYIWAGLIVLALAFALVTDVADLKRDTYRNGRTLAATLVYKKPPPEGARQAEIDVIIDPQVYRDLFGGSASPAAAYPATLVRAESGLQVRFAKNTPFPEPLLTMQEFLGGDDKELRARVEPLPQDGPPFPTTVQLRFDRVWFVKLRAITLAAFEFSKTAVTLALGLIGTLALWLGLMKIAEAAGLIAVFVRLVQPVLGPIFPQIPRGHPALGMIALNLAANMLGLGNAATPMGLKAMEEMQKLNPTDDTATDPMVMLLAINTAGVQLVPSATLVAIMGLGVAELFVPILVVTGLTLVISIVSCKICERLPRYRRTNPNLVAATQRGTVSQ